MDSPRVEHTSLAIFALSSASSPSLRELKECPAGQQVKVMAKTNNRLAEQPLVSRWETPENVVAYRKINHSLISGVAEEADLTAYPLHASFHSNKNRYRSRIPFYISLDAEPETIGAWFLQPPGRAQMARPSSKPQVVAREQKDGSTWIGLVDERLELGTQLDLNCTISRTTGRIYSVTLATGSLQRLDYDSNNQLSPTETRIDTRTSQSEHVFHGGTFPDANSTCEVVPGKQQYTIHLRPSLGFSLHCASDSSPSAVFAYDMRLRTYCFYQGAARDCAPVLLGNPVEHGFSASAAWAPSTGGGSFEILASEVTPLREHADMRLPTWNGNMALARDAVTASGGARPSSRAVVLRASPETSAEEGEEQQRRKTRLLRRRDRGQSITAAEMQAAGFRTQQEFARFEREQRPQQERSPRSRANV